MSAKGKQLDEGKTRVLEILEDLICYHLTSRTALEWQTTWIKDILYLFGCLVIEG